MSHMGMNTEWRTLPDKEKTCVGDETGEKGKHMKFKHSNARALTAKGHWLGPQDLIEELGGGSKL